MMKIVISHKSALEYWRLHRNMKISDFKRQRRKSLPKSIPHIAVIRNLLPSGLSYPINMMISEQSVKRTTSTVKSRVYTGPTPEGCFISLNSGLTVCAPPFCFFQMAVELPLIKLIELGLEFCGSYSKPAFIEYDYVIENESEDVDSNNSEHKQSAEHPQLFGHPQLTNIKAIKAFAANMEGVGGHKKVCRALRYMADGSASPMETILYMLLILPYKLGGYGLPAPELNKRIDLRPKSKRGSGKSYYVCDLFWPEANLAVEYDSDFYHTGADRIASDARKRQNLDSIGIKVITVTSRQIRNINEFDIVTKQIAEKLNKRVRYNRTQFDTARRELRGLLL